MGLLAKLVVNSEVASLAEDLGFMVDGFSREGLWGIACGASELSPA
jgi:hypothetical protein